MGLTVRQMRREDIEKVMEIDRITFSDLQERLSGQPCDLPLREREFFEFWLDADPKGAFVAERNGDVIGLNFNHARGRSGWFGPLAVSPGDQSGGAGKALLQAGMEYLEGRRCAMIGLDTYPHNPVAVGMYLKNGFEIVGSTVQLKLGLPLQHVADGEKRRGSAIAIERIGRDDLGDVIGTEEGLSGFNRGKDFAFLLGWKQAFGLQARDGAKRLGYLWGYRKRGKGVIGCLHVADEERCDEIGLPLLGAAFDGFAALGLDEIVCLGDGSQSRQLGFLFRVGFRTQSTMVKLHRGDVQPRRPYSPLASEKG